MSILMLMFIDIRNTHVRYVIHAGCATTMTVRSFRTLIRLVTRSIVLLYIVILSK